VLSTLSTTSGREMMEGRLKSFVNLEKALARGSGKLSDLPPAQKLKAWDPWVPGLFVAFLYWAVVSWRALLGALHGTGAVLRVVWYYLTFRPKAIRYPGPRSTAKEFSFSEAIDLKDIKVVQKAFSAPGKHITLNDVMCAVVTRSMQEHYAAVGAPADRRSVSSLFALRLLLLTEDTARISFFIPISVRALDDFSMSNQLTGLVAHLPADAGLSTRQLIHAAHDTMLGFKSSFWPALIFRAVQWMFGVPALFPGPDNFIVADMLTSIHACVAVPSERGRARTVLIAHAACSRTSRARPLRSTWRGPRCSGAPRARRRAARACSRSASSRTTAISCGP
jgi:hypothetical protein